MLFQMEIIVHNIQNVTSVNELKDQNNFDEECTICFSNDSKLVKLPDCNHSFCQGCVVDYLNTQISDFNVLKIKCLQDGCKCLLKENFIQTILNKKTFEKYQRFVIQKINNRSSEVKICPKPGCSKPFKPRLDTEYTKCKCNTLICNTCCEPYHEGKTCLAAIDPEFEIYAKENGVKLCIMCKTLVTRVEGCTHITCPVCDYEWCWLCGQEHSELHAGVCKGKWNPIPPKSIHFSWEDIKVGQLLFKGIWNFFIFIILLPFRAVFWPFYVFDAMERFRSPIYTNYEKFEIFIISLVLNVFSVASWLVLAYLIWRFPGSALVLGITLGFAVMFPLFAKLGMNIYAHIKNKKRRWVKKGNKVFGYTNAHKPIEQLRDNQSKEIKEENKEVNEVGSSNEEANGSMKTAINNPIPLPETLQIQVLSH